MASFLCPEIVADDWGFSRGINDGILDLAQRKILKRVSLIANAELLSYRLEELIKLSEIKFAWHLNFTAGRPLIKGSSLSNSKTQTFYRLKHFIWRWFSGQILVSDLINEAREQIWALKNSGVSIDEIDGHHHVHLVPGLLPALAPLYSEFKIKNFRLPVEKTHLSSYLASFIIQRNRNRFPLLNLKPYGYPQKRHFSDRQLFVKASRNGRLPVLVHPAAYDDFQGNSYGDLLCAERVDQYKTLINWFA